MYFPYFQIFSTKVPPKFEKYMKLLDICGDTISKCPDLMRNNTPLLAHSLDSSSSIELKLLVNHYESPCSYNVYLNVINHAISTEIFHENRPLQRRKNKIPPCGKVWPSNQGDHPEHKR